MKAMVLEDTASIDSEPLRLLDLPAPEPAENEVRLRVRCCAICRTDLHVIEGDLERGKRPIVPGHQVVGTVDALGADAHRWKVGQRLGIAWLRHTCQVCEFCRAGKENLCEASRYTGYHDDGGYAEYAIVPEAYAHEIPAAYDDVTAAPLLCAGIIGYRALKRCQVRSGGRLALYGFGSSAHIVMQIAKHRGCEVYIVTRGESHRELARRMGATWVGSVNDSLPASVDSAIVFAPAGTLVPPALEALRKGGTLALAGIYMTQIPPLDYRRHLFFERNLHSVTANTREDGRDLLAEAAEAGVQPQTSVYPLEAANQALQDLSNDRIDGTGELVVDAQP